MLYGLNTVVLFMAASSQPTLRALPWCVRSTHPFLVMMLHCSLAMRSLAMRKRNKSDNSQVHSLPFQVLGMFHVSRGPGQTLGDPCEQAVEGQASKTGNSNGLNHDQDKISHCYIHLSPSFCFFGRCPFDWAGLCIPHWELSTAEA